MRGPLSPALRAPLLGFGLGAVAGGLEAVKIGTRFALEATFGEAMALGAVAVGLDGILGALIAVPVGLIAGRIGRSLPRQYAGSMAATAGLLALWFLLQAAAVLWAQGRAVAAVAFSLSPIGLVGVVWFNAAYWFRREEIGEEYRFGWRGWSITVGLALAAVNAGLIASRDFGSSRAIETDPAVLMITVDTLRRDHLSAYGDAPVQTPVFDAIAAEGVRFDDAITPLPETAPAHAALLTERHPARNGVLSNFSTLARSYTTLPERLKDEGYATAAFVSSYALDSRVGLDQGFEIYDDDFAPGVRGLSEILVVQWGLRLLFRFGDPADYPFLFERSAPDTYRLALRWATRNADKPFFLWVHTFEPHAPYEPHGLPGFEDNGTPAAPALDHRAILAKEPGYVYTDEERARLKRLYAEEVAYTDQQLGIFLDQLKAAIGARPLMLVVTADHGEMLGEHGINFAHAGLYEPVLRVPLAIVPPKALAYKTQVVGEQIRLMDVPATILDQLKLDPMDKGEGAELMGYALGTREKDLGTMLVGRAEAFRPEGLLLGYRTGPAKVLWTPATDQLQLYDLTTDREEQRDLAAEQAAAVAPALARIKQEAAGLLNGTPEDEADPAVRARLKALGYLE